MNAILGEVVDSVKEHTKDSNGDLQVLIRILSALGREEMVDFIVKLEVPALLVADFVHLRDRFVSSAEKAQSTAAFDALYDIRISTLCWLMHCVPESFSADLIEQLWLSFFTDTRIPASVRGQGWDTLSSVLKNLQIRDQNPFIDQVLERHIEELHPQDYCVYNATLSTDVQSGG
jgi:hypothetical protein